MTSPFESFRHEDVAALIGEYPLAWVAARDGEAPATPLPLLAECAEDGRIVSLFGHIAKRNPLTAALEAAPCARILFNGPQGYIAPGLVARPDWGPTWNYAVVRFDVRIEFVPEQTDAALRQLAAHLESDNASPWTSARMGPRYVQLREHIVAFRAHVAHVHATFKLGQDEAPDTFAQIVAGHADPALRRWMQRMRGA